MLLSVIGRCLVGDVVDRAAYKFEIIQKERGRECHLQVYRTAYEAIVGLCGLNISGDLFCGVEQDKLLSILFDRESEIEDSQPAFVLTSGGDHVFTCFQGSCCRCIQSNFGVVVHLVCGEYLNSVDIECGCVIVAVYEV